MRLHDKKRFIDKDRLEAMIKLRRTGLAESSLAIIFNVDRSTIRYHLKKYYITHPPQIYAIERIVSRTLPPPIFQGNWKVINGERFNVGKSYKEYLAT